MNDRELLEMAAKAAGIEISDWSSAENGFIRYYFVTRHIWNPLTDDADEARLEAALGLNVVWCFYTVKVGESLEPYIAHNADKQAARRRAGVRAAAEIGKTL